jgi:hypothetical protein
VISFATIGLYLQGHWGMHSSKDRFSIMCILIWGTHFSSCWEKESIWMCIKYRRSCEWVHEHPAHCVHGTGCLNTELQFLCYTCDYQRVCDEDKPFNCARPLIKFIRNPVQLPGTFSNFRSVVSVTGLPYNGDRNGLNSSPFLPFMNWSNVPTPREYVL